jgi:hypothetical protein
MSDPVLAQTLETAVTSTNGNEQTVVPASPPESPGTTAWFKADGTLMVWLILFTLGGGIMALYYAHIRYLPDIEWSMALIYLASSTIIGGGVGLLFAMSLFLPGFIWSESLIFDSRLKRKFCYDKNKKELCVQTIIDFLGKPFGKALLVAHLPLVVGQFYTSLWALLAAYVVVTVPLIIWVRWRMRKNLDDLLTATPERQQEKPAPAILTEEVIPKQQREIEQQEREDERWKFKCVAWFVLSLVLSLASVFTIYALSQPKDLVSFVVLTLICTAGVLISNHVVALHYHFHYKQAVVAALVATGFLLMTADWFSPLSLRIMGYYGLGGDRKGELVVTDEGAKVVGDLGLTLCRTRTVCNVEILSKLGEEYYLVADGKTFTLRKSVVQSYQSYDPRPAQPRQGR